MDGIYELAKFHGVHIDPNGPAIKFFHNYQRLVKESRQEGGLDPFPNKYMANLDVLVKAFAQIMKNR